MTLNQSQSAPLVFVHSRVTCVTVFQPFKESRSDRHFSYKLRLRRSGVAHFTCR
jgi:hypothetical protein